MCPREIKTILDKKAKETHYLGCYQFSKFSNSEPMIKNQDAAWSRVTSPGSCWVNKSVF